MRIGIFGFAVNDGTIDQVIGEARSAEAGGFSSYWAPQIFGHDALTALALAGREVPRIELGTSVVPTFPRHPIAARAAGAHRQRGVPEDLRRPVGAEAAGLGAARLPDHLVDGAVVDGKPEDPDPHESAR